MFIQKTVDIIASLAWQVTCISSCF